MRADVKRKDGRRERSARAIVVLAAAVHGLAIGPLVHTIGHKNDHEHDLLGIARRVLEARPDITHDEFIEAINTAVAWHERQHAAGTARNGIEDARMPGRPHGDGSLAHFKACITQAPPPAVLPLAQTTVPLPVTPLVSRESRDRHHAPESARGPPV